MIRPAVSIDVMPLQLKLKTTIHHAAATRNESARIWVRATRNCSFYKEKGAQSFHNLKPRKQEE